MKETADYIQHENSVHEEVEMTSNDIMSHIFEEYGRQENRSRRDKEEVESTTNDIREEERNNISYASNHGQYRYERHKEDVGKKVGI